MLLIIAVICFHHAKYRSKVKTWEHANSTKIETNEFKKARIKSRALYYFDDIIKYEDFDFDNMDLFEFIMKLDIYYYLVLKMMTFIIRLDTL